MKNNNFDILFAVMAIQEVVFFSKIAKKLSEDSGYTVCFLLFHEAGDDILEKEGIKYFNIHKLVGKSELSLTDNPVKEVEDKYSLPNIRDIYTHEMLTTNRKNEKLLALKTINYLDAFEKLFKDNNIRCVIQELGGFIAPRTLYCVAKKKGIRHIFIEPAMFCRRLVFTLDDIYADIPDYSTQGEISKRTIEIVREYAQRYSSDRVVVIPHKDKLFFQDMNLRRLFAPVNFRKLARKLYHKYIVRKKEEYDAILRYVLFHILKLLRRKLLTFYYSRTDKNDKYIYLPLHVPLDVQLTVRCPQFLDQEKLIEYISGCIPSGYKLYIKEHPASIGAHSVGKLRDLLKHKNIKLLHPYINSFELIKNSSCVITINSKVGAEAIMQNKPVVVLGKTFYKNKGVTFDVEDISKLPEIIKKAISDKIDKDNIKHFLAKTYEWSYPGELYDNSDSNVDEFYHSLESFIANNVNFQNETSKPREVFNEI